MKQKIELVPQEMNLNLFQNLGKGKNELLCQCFL